MRPNPKVPNWLGEGKTPRTPAARAAPAAPAAPPPAAEAAPTVPEGPPAEPATPASKDSATVHFSRLAKAERELSAADRIILHDVEVHYHVGVPDEERSKPQRLMISVELTTDFTAAATTDFLATTIDYHRVYERLLHFGEGRTWKLIEKLAYDLVSDLLKEFPAQEATVEVKKFILKKARYTAVRVTRRRAG